MLIWILGYFWSVPTGSQSTSRVGACTWAFLLSCSSRVMHTFAAIRGSVAFPRGFPTGLSHVPPWCESILGFKVEAVQGKQVSLEWTETSGDSGNGGTTLEFLSPFLSRARPLEMRRERGEFFPHHAGKGSLLSSYEAETGILWMWAGLSCFLSSGDGYVGELLELQQGCERPFVSSRC